MLRWRNGNGIGHDQPHFRKLPYPLRVTSADVARIGGEKNGDDGVPMALGDGIGHRPMDMRKCSQWIGWW